MGGQIKYVVDIDGTICEKRADLDYVKCFPYSRRIQKLNELYDAGHIIVYYTGRREDKRFITEKWLRDNGVKYHELIMNKPIGVNGETVYIDDLNVIPGEFFGDE